MKDKEARAFLDLIEEGGKAILDSGNIEIEKIDPESFRWTEAGEPQMIRRRDAMRRLKRFEPNLGMVAEFVTADGLMNYPNEIDEETEPTKTNLDYARGLREPDPETLRQVEADIAVEEIVEAELVGGSDGFPRNEVKEEVMEQKQTQPERIQSWVRESAARLARQGINPNKAHADQALNAVQEEYAPEKAERRKFVTAWNKEKGSLPEALEVQEATEVEEKKTPEPRKNGKRGKLHIEATREEAFALARKKIEEGDEEYKGFKSWVVDLDGTQISPKWLVRLLTGVPAPQFTPPQAAAALKKIGIEVKRV
jgi:hypothetical protein